MKKENPYANLHKLYAPFLPKMDPRDGVTPYFKRGYHNLVITKPTSFAREREIEEYLRILQTTLGDNFELIRVTKNPPKNIGFTANIEYNVAY